jgi:hypothetical protein
VRRYLPKLIELVLLDLTLPLDQVAEGYRAMDERRDQDAATAKQRELTT